MINCVIPLRVRIAGTPDGEQLDRLSDTIAQAVRSRLAFARRELAHREIDLAGGVLHPPVVRFREPPPEITEALIRAAVEDGLDRGIRGESASPRIVLAQHRTGAAAAAASRRRARWFVSYAARFHLRLEDFVSFYETTRSPFIESRDLRRLYADRLNDIVRAAAWIVEPRTYVTEEEIVLGVQERFARLVSPDQPFFFVYSIRDADRSRVRLMDLRGELSALPELPPAALGVLPDGRYFLRTRTRMLFVLVPVPMVVARTTIDEHEPIEIRLRVRDVAFLVNPADFERLFDVQWQHYLEEFGDRPASLHVQPFNPQRPIHIDTLRAVLREAIASRVPGDQAFFPRLRLLNRSTLDSLPEAARAALAYIGVDSQLNITDEQAEGAWSEDWTGVYLYTVLSPTEEEKEVATYNPVARQHADALIPLLQQSRRYPWSWRLLTFLTSRYRGQSFRVRRSGATAFGYLLAELERRENGRWFREFFEAVDGSRNGDLQYFVAEIVMASRFATHTRAQQSIRLLNRQRRSLQRHTYDVVNKVILIDHDEDQPLRRSQLAFDVDSAFTVTREAKQLRAPRLAALQAAVEIEGRELLGRILRGEDTTSYTQETFALTAVGTAAQRVGIVEDDFEDLVIERTPRLRDVELRVEDGVERYYVTVDYFERVNEGPWHLVPDSVRRMVDGEFEFLLWSFRYEKAAAGVQVLAIGVSVLAVIVIAWEVGAIGFLVQAAGGWINVGLAIGISELIYICTHEHRTPEGYLMAALEGYLFALGFRGAGFIGRALARHITTDSMQRVILGLIAERIAVGSIGGATSAAMVLFSHDILDIALGRKERFSSLGDYVRHMALGAVVGVLMEFVGGALQLILRAAGRTALDTVANFARRLHAEGISVTVWTEAMEAAVQRISGNVASFMDRIRAGELAEAFGERVAQVTQALRDLRQTALFQRVLELADVQLTRQVNEGLDRLLLAAQGRLAIAELLAMLNALRASPARLRAFLEAMQLLDDAAARTLGERGALTSFSRADRLHGLLRGRGGEVGWPFLHRVFGVSVARAERYLERLLAHGTTQRDRVVDILLREGQRVPPDMLLLTLERLGTISARTLHALDRLYASAERAAADAFLGSLTPERFAQILTFLERLGPAFLRVPREQLDEGALQGLDRLLSLSAAHMSDDAIAAVLNRLRQTPRLPQFLAVIRALDDRVVTGLAETGQNAALGDAANLLNMLTRRGAASWELVARRFNGVVDAAEEFLTRLAPRTPVQQNRAIDILLDAANVVTPQGMLSATEKLAAVTDAALAGLNRIYANADAAAMDAFLAGADAAALERLLPWLGGLGNRIVADLAQNGYLPALAASPRVVAFAMAGRNLGRLFRVVRARPGTPDQVIRSLEQFQDVNAAVTELLGRGALSQEVVEVAAMIDRPAYPGGSAQAIRNTAELIADDVQVPVAREVLALPQGVNVTRVTVAGAGAQGPDAVFTLDTGRAIGREATHTQSGAATAADLFETVINRVQTKVDDFRANARGLNYESREVHVQIRRSAANVDFDPMLTQGFLTDLVNGLRDVAAIDRLVLYDSRGNIVRTWSR